MDSAEPADIEQQPPPDLVRSDAAYIAAYVDSVLNVYMVKAEWATQPGQDPLSNTQAPLDCHTAAPPFDCHTAAPPFDCHTAVPCKPAF